MLFATSSDSKEVPIIEGLQGLMCEPQPFEDCVTVIATWSFPRQDLALHRHISHHGRSMHPSSCRSHCCSRLNLRSLSDDRLRFHVAAVLLGPRWITTIKLRSTLQHEMSCWLFLCFCWNCTRFDYTRGCLLKQIVYSLFTSLMTTACNNQLDHILDKKWETN